MVERCKIRMDDDGFFIEDFLYNISCVLVRGFLPKLNDSPAGFGGGGGDTISYHRWSRQEFLQLGSVKSLIIDADFYALEVIVDNGLTFFVINHMADKEFNEQTLAIMSFTSGRKP